MALLLSPQIRAHKKAMVEVKNSAQNERYVSGIFANEEKINKE